MRLDSIIFAFVFFVVMPAAGAIRDNWARGRRWNGEPVQIGGPPPRR